MLMVRLIVGLKKPLILWIENTQREGHGPWLSGYTDGVVTGSDPTVLGLSRCGPTILWAAIWLKVPSSGLCGSFSKDDRIAWCWALGLPV
ncbi:hypothetical protein F2Q70_00011429 [Brassica cretica]|uniref:Uncharacterized protein n=1 Tax=Brassica cretica TaxID=69181 RepID=A0A8S9LZR7_BRACR|nr:hypothetical protein F2Q70_00011429 [Brassica cretica]